MLIAGVDSGGPFEVVPGPLSEENQLLPSPAGALRLSLKANGVTKRWISISQSLCNIHSDGVKELQARAVFIMDIDCHNCVGFSNEFK